MNDLAIFLKTIYEREPVTISEAIDETITRTGLSRMPVLKLYFMSKKRNLIDICCNNKFRRDVLRGKLAKPDAYLSLKPSGIKYLQNQLKAR